MKSELSPEQLEAERKEILRRYKLLCKALQDKSEEEDALLLRKAFELATEAHKDMRRKSGEPYIYHPIAVAQIAVEEMGLGNTSAICALLHDTVEDTEVTLEDIDRIFGKKIARIIDGLTKISSVIDYNNNSTSDQAENFRKILLTLSDDVRVILVKLADRLHNMRTLDAMKREKQMKIASETLYLYAPIAHRLGIYNVKTELEDLSLKYTQPDIYLEIQEKLASTDEARKRFISKFTLPIRRNLTAMGLEFEIKGRSKSIYSIYNKIKNKGVPFEEIYDIFAIRIIIESPTDTEKSDCWRVYSVITDFYQPSPERLRDWISTPRVNGYESLHTTVMSPTGKWVEVQIRSKRMDQMAERGLAAHWRYKEHTNDKRENAIDTWITRVRELLEHAEQEENTFELLNTVKSDLFAEEIFVFTPKGQVRNLPSGATALDFAFEIHTEVGQKCIGAKINNKLVPLSTKLKSGDQVEVITSPKQKPREDWLNIVTTTKAKTRIKKALQEDKRKIASLGQEILERKFKNQKYAYNEENIEKLIKHYRAGNVLDLEYLIGSTKIEIKSLSTVLDAKPVMNVFDALAPDTKDKDIAKIIKKYKEDSLLIGDDMDKMDYNLSPCCSPIPGDEVFGFVTIKEGIKIHKVSCGNAVQLLSNYAYRVVKARWISQQTIAFLSGIKVTGIDEIGLVNNITKIISNELNVNMRSISFDTQDGIFEGLITVYVYDTEHLKDLISKIAKVNGVLHVNRVDYKPS